MNSFFKIRKDLPSFLPPYTAMDVHKHSYWLGLMIGPCTVMTNSVKLIGDLAKIIFYGSLSINYFKSEEYEGFKLSEDRYKERCSSKFRPVLIKKETNYEESLRNDDYYDFDHFKFALHYKSRHSPLSNNRADDYNMLSKTDKRKVAFDHALEDAKRHIGFIALGIIRTIPIVGAAMIWRIVKDSKIENGTCCSCEEKFNEKV